MFSRRATNVRTIAVILGLLLCCLSALAQTGKCVISGTVVDASGSVLQGAQITLLPQGNTAVSDAQGVFTFIGLPAGSYQLSISVVGFAQYSQDMTLEAGQVKHLTAEMKVASVKDEVLVVAERQHGEADAINQTRSAENIQQVLPSEVILSLPNANAADALGRMPSVTLTRIEGEGVYIQVRGTEPRLTNVTIDGITVPSPEPTIRYVRLDVIPSDLIETVELNKTLSANQDGNGIGGSVNLRIRKPADEPYFVAEGLGGYTPILNGRSLTQFDSTYGQRFGSSKKFGILFGGTYDYNGRGIDNIQPGLDPRSTFAQPFYDNDTIREYRYYRHRYGFAGSADYRFSDSNSIYGHGFYSDLKDWGDKWYFQPVSTAISSSGALPSPTANSPSPKFYTSSKRPNASVGSLGLGGRHVFSSSWLTWETSVSRSYEVDSAGNPKADFSWNGPKVQCNYDPSTQADPMRPTFGACDGASSMLQTDTNWILKDLTTSKGLTAELNLTATASYAKNYQLGSHFGKIEGGFKFSNGHKYQDATETVYDGWKSSIAPTMAQLEDKFRNTDYYNGTYFGGKYGPVSNFNDVVSYVNQNLGSYVDGYKTAASSYPNQYDIIERIAAGYLMNSMDFGKLHVQAGVRIEATNMDTLGNNVTLYAANSAKCGSTSNTGCGVPVPVSNNPSYIDWLPSLQLRYALTKDSNIRAVYSRGVARPDGYQLVPYITADESSNPWSVSIGNPKLKPEHANNYDLLYEQFFKPLGMLQAGVFVKQLTAPEVSTSVPNSVNLASLPAGNLPPTLLNALAEYPYSANPANIGMYINGQNAYLYGFEVGYQQHLTYLPSVFRGLGISANYSYTQSSEKGLPLRTDSPQLQQQSANSWNISPTYDTKRFSARVGISYNGANIYQYQWVSSKLVSGADPSGLGPKGPSGDVWTLPHTQLDAQVSYKITHNLTAMAYGLNLTNEVFGYYTGSKQFVNQREYYRPSYAGGLKYTFTPAR